MEVANANSVDLFMELCYFFYFEEVYLEMGKEATATFIGHKECYGVHERMSGEKLKSFIASGLLTSLNGGMGGFDWMCARVAFDLRKSYPQIRNYLCHPLPHFQHCRAKILDDIIYPEGFEKYRFKAAIPARESVSRR